MSQYQLQFARDTTHIPPHLMSLLSQQSMPPPQYEQPMPQQGPSLDSFLTALSDVMRTHGISPSMPWGPGQVMPPSSQLPHHNEQQEMNHTMQPIQSPAILHNGSNSHSSTTSRSTPSVEIPSDRSSPVSGVLPPSFRRKSSPVHPTSPELRPSSLKEKQRAVSPNPLRRRPPYVGPSRSPHEAVTSPRSTQTGKVFTSATGEELAFFVQIDLSNRFSVVSSIKVRVCFLMAGQGFDEIHRKTEAKSSTTTLPRITRFYILGPKRFPISSSQRSPQINLRLVLRLCMIP